MLQEVAREPVAREPHYRNSMGNYTDSAQLIVLPINICIGMSNVCKWGSGFISDKWDFFTMLTKSFI